MHVVDGRVAIGIVVFLGSVLPWLQRNNDIDYTDNENGNDDSVASVGTLELGTRAPEMPA